MEEKLKINVVKTNICCFISDCDAAGEYDYEYHHSKINNLLFDGELPEPTFCKNWLKIKKYPSIIQRKVDGERINLRYEIINKNLVSDKMPAVIPAEQKANYDQSAIDSLYRYEYDTGESFNENVDCELSTVCEIDNFKEPVKFNYEAIHQSGFEDEIYNVENIDIKHQLFDKIIFPEIVLHNRPCSLTSKEVYDITRQYVRSNINKKVAEITSDYDFCFSVKKLIPLWEPETVSFQNIFARTKKECNKIHLSVHNYKQIDIFEMTSKEKKRDGYTVIERITANSEKELKDKLDEWLSTLIEIINKPLNLCPYCHGTGYEDVIENVDGNKIINKINAENKE